MPTPARFLFDTDFAAPPPKPPPAKPPEPTITVAEHGRLLAEAVAKAEKRAEATGRESAEAKAAGRLADEAGRLAAAAQSILAVIDGERARIEAEAVRLAETVGRTIAGRLYDLAPRDAVLAVVDEAFAPLRKAPHLVVRLATADADAIRSALEAAAHVRGFEGRLIVLGEPGMARGDCRIEWADGGIVAERAVTEAAVARAVAAHIASLAGEGNGNGMAS